MFKKNKLAFIAICCLISLYLVSIFADFIAPYKPNLQNPNSGYAAPTRVFWDTKGFYIKKQEKKYYIKFLQEGKLFQVDKPASINLLGADRIGRDVFSRLVHGSRPSLSIGFIGLLITFPLGMLYGGISGFAGGWVDNLMMRLAEAIMSLPGFYLLIILSAMLPASLNNIERFAMITFILSFISWTSFARIIRGQVLSIRAKEFIEAARAIGQKKLVIVSKHLLPHTFSFVIIAATLSVPSFIIGETALSFLGLGINQPDPSWGNILAEGKDLANILTRPWLLWSPALLIFVAVFSFNILGDFLRDVFDPRH